VNFDCRTLKIDIHNSTPIHVFSLSNLIIVSSILLGYHIRGSDRFLCLAFGAALVPFFENQEYLFNHGLHNRQAVSVPYSFCYFFQLRIVATNLLPHRFCLRSKVPSVGSRCPEYFLQDFLLCTFVTFSFLYDSKGEPLQQATNTAISNI